MKEVYIHSNGMERAYTLRYPSFAGSYVNEDYNDRLAIDPAPGIIYIMSGTKSDEYTFRFIDKTVMKDPEMSGISWKVKNDGTTQTWQLKPTPS